MTGYDKKRITLANHGEVETTITRVRAARCRGRWPLLQPTRVFEARRPGGKGVHAFEFPDWINAYWVRTVSSADDQTVSYPRS